jgi:hypothetical protein
MVACPVAQSKARTARGPPELSAQNTGLDTG